MLMTRLSKRSGLESPPDPACASGHTGLLRRQREHQFPEEITKEREKDLARYGEIVKTAKISID